MAQPASIRLCASRGPSKRRKALIEPEFGGGAAAELEALEKVPAQVARALFAEPLEVVVSGDPPDAEPAKLVRRPDNLAILERFELAAQGRVELDLLDPGGDFARRFRQPVRH